MKFSVESKTRFGYGVALASLLLIGIASCWSSARSASVFASIHRTDQFLAQLETVRAQILDIEARGLRFALSGEEVFVEGHLDRVANLRDAFATIRELAPELAAAAAAHQLPELETRLEQKIARMNEAIRLRRANDIKNLDHLFSADAGGKQSEDLRATFSAIQEKERATLTARLETANRAAHTSVFVAGASTLLAVTLVTALGLVVRRDLRKRLEAQEALRESEENLAVTLNSIGDAVMATDCEGRITRMNRVAEELTGWPLAEARHRPIAEIFDIVNEHTRQPAVIPVDAVLATGVIQGLANHTLLIARDGTTRPIADSAAPIRGTDGRILGVVLVFRDVTAEHAAEQAIRENAQRLALLNEQLERRVEERTAEVHEALATLDASEDAAFIFDPETLRFTFANKGASLQLGFSREELLGLTPADITLNLSEARLREMLAPLTRNGGSTHRFTTTHRHKDGHEVPVEINLQYLAPQGERARFSIMARNIAERLKVERQSIRSQRLEAIGTLASGVAHDLNNALAPILLGVELLKAQHPSDTRMIEIFEVSAKRGANMVRQLLTFAKGAEGKRLSVQPRQAIKEMSAIIDATFPKNIRHKIEWDTDLPLIRCDPTQLHQVLLNLCVNARDAMPDGGTLTLEARRGEIDASFASSLPDAKPGNYVVLKVCDTGVGIPPEIIDRIVEPFFTTKGPDKGTGLGLSTVAGILKGHEGFLRIHSRPNEGSTFAAYLPVEAEPGTAEPASRASSAFQGHGETILFVDDEALVRQVVCEVLGRANLRPLVATDGLDGLIQLTEHRGEIRAIVSDLHMPHMDGLTFVQTLRRVLPNVPIAIASGRLENRKMAEFTALGVTRHLDKPFTEAQLLETLQQMLEAK